jgi:enoyl-CoA hydratase/carnithine racemase
LTVAANSVVDLREQTRDGVTIAVLTMSSAPANALGDDLIEALGSTLERVARTDARALVVSSSIPGYFAVGADLKLLGTFDGTRFEDYLSRVTGAIEQLPKLGIPSIAAIAGQAVGGGLELALACSLRVAAKGSKLGLPEVKLGLLPGAGGTQRLTRLVGRARALDLLLSGRSLSAEEALEAGFVDRVADAGEELVTATEVAFRFAAMPRHAVGAILRCVDVALTAPLSDGLAYEAEEVRALFATDDAREGVRAFIERRKPSFG